MHSPYKTSPTIPAGSGKDPAGVVLTLGHSVAHSLFDPDDFPDVAPTHDPELEALEARLASGESRMCGRCYDEVPATFPPNCAEKPERLLGAPLGMYHCPDCGAMVVAWIEHPELCALCLDRKHPYFDGPQP